MVRHLIIYVILASVSALAEGLPAIAVSDIKTTGFEKNQSALFHQELNALVIQTKKYQVIERAQIDKLVAEQGFQMSGTCEGSGCGVEIGKLLGAQFIIIGEATLDAGIVGVVLRIVNVENGAIVSSAQEKFRGSIDTFINEIFPGVLQTLLGEHHIHAISVKTHTMKYLKWSGLGAGVLSSGAALYYYFESEDRYTTYSNAAQGSDFPTLRASVEEADTYFYIASSIALTTFLLSGYGWYTDTPEPPLTVIVTPNSLHLSMRF